MYKYAKLNEKHHYLFIYMFYIYECLCAATYIIGCVLMYDQIRLNIYTNHEIMHNFW